MTQFIECNPTILHTLFTYAHFSMRQNQNLTRLVPSITGTNTHTWFVVYVHLSLIYIRVYFNTVTVFSHGISQDDAASNVFQMYRIIHFR